MSRVGKYPVTVPSGVTVALQDGVVVAKGKLGELRLPVVTEAVDVKIEDGSVTVSPKGEDRRSRTLWGTTRSLINGMVTGVSTGFSKKLQLVGVGYRAALKGSDLEMQLGFSHPVLVQAPENITFEVPSQTEIIVSGPSKEQVGQVAANIRKWRKPEPYKGKGIRYEGEHVRRKAGKAGKD